MVRARSRRRGGLEMYLSRLVLNPMDSEVRRGAGDCGRMHRTLMGAFPEVDGGQSTRAQLGVLYRVEELPGSGNLLLLVQSRQEPDWSCLPPGYLLATGVSPENPACKEVSSLYAGLQVGQSLVFRLRANPTKKVDTTSGKDGSRRNGRRVALLGEAEQIAWLERKANQHGFQIVESVAKPALLDVHPGATQGVRGLGSGGRNLTFSSVQYDGRLRVADRDLFVRALEDGIGPAKAFGFGLLSVAPAGPGS